VPGPQPPAGPEQEGVSLRRNRATQKAKETAPEAVGTPVPTYPSPGGHTGPSSAPLLVLSPLGLCTVAAGQSQPAARRGREGRCRRLGPGAFYWPGCASYAGTEDASCRPGGRGKCRSAKAKGRTSNSAPTGVAPGELGFIAQGRDDAKLLTGNNVGRRDDDWHRRSTIIISRLHGHEIARTHSICSGPWRLAEAHLGKDPEPPISRRVKTNRRIRCASECGNRIIFLLLLRTFVVQGKLSLT
jgi:hypothetical protein